MAWHSRTYGFIFAKNPININNIAAVATGLRTARYLMDRQVMGAEIMGEFWALVSKAELKVGNGTAKGLGVLCLTAIVLVALLV